jgi:low temperature requirement protein LtrA
VGLRPGGLRTGGRRITVPDPHEDFAANPVELFFDLAFVFAYSQLVSRVVSDPSADGLAEAGLLFLLLWLPWTQFAWSLNAVSAHSRPVQVVVLIATAASVPMAASVSSALEGAGPAFAIPLTIILGTGLAVMVAGYETGSAEFMSSVRYSIPNMVTMALLVVGAFAEGELRTALWVAAVVAVLLGTVRAGSGDWVVRPRHFAERHGLIVIIALGEVVVATALPLVLGLEEGEGIPARSYASLAAAGAFACLLWWCYFDRPQPAFEHGLAALHGRARGRYARDVYTYLHAPIVAGIIVAAAALEEITLHPDDELPLEFRLMLFAGLLLFAGGIEGAAYRAHRLVPPERAVALVVIAAVTLPALSVAGLALLVVVDAILLVAVVAEHVRKERATAARAGAVS